MGVENKFKPSKQKLQQRIWFWPAVYSALAILLIFAVVGYTFLSQPNDSAKPADQEANSEGGGTTIPVNVQGETMKYPLKEELITEAQILQEFYDVNAAPEIQQNALLVFNQTYSTSQGISISVKGEPFEVLAAMSGEVQSVKMDPFTGNKVTLVHANGYTTIYNSVGEILVQEGDHVKQGEPIGTTIENESNPYAGVHLHFQVKKDDVFINPKTLLAF
jgi:stage II sporulation protein Q